MSVYDLKDSVPPPVPFRPNAPMPAQDWSGVADGSLKWHELDRLFYRPRPQGLRLPWDKCRSAISFEPGRWTLWSGVTFSGKTQLLRMLALHAARSGQKPFFCSLEEDCADIIDEFAIMAAQTTEPSRAFLAAFGEWASERIEIADTRQMLTTDEALDLMRYAVQHMDCEQLFLDSMMRLSLPVDAFEQQRKFGNAIGEFVSRYGVHLHIVVHPRKTLNSRQALDLYDIRGAGDLVNQADNVAMFHREYKPKSIEDPTNYIRVFKHRGRHSWEGSIGLRYHRPSHQFLAEHGDAPIQFTSWHSFPANEEAEA